MKKIILSLILLSFFSASAQAGAPKMESVDITAENQFTDSLTVEGPFIIAIDDTGSMSMTITLQMSAGGSWIDTGDAWTSEIVHAMADGCKRAFRVGCKTGDFTSGTASVYIMSRGGE